MGCGLFVLGCLQALAELWDRGREVSAFDDNVQSEQELRKC